MNFENFSQTLLSLMAGLLHIFEDPPPNPPAWQMFLGHFVYFFYLPFYLVLLAARSLFVDFKGFLLPRFGRRLAEGINRLATLVLAGFLPGWMTTFAVHVWYPEMTPDQGLLAGYGVVFGFVLVYNVLIVRTVPGLNDLLGRGYWHSVAIGGFFLGLYVGLFLMSLEALLAALTFLMMPLGAILILPFVAASIARPAVRPEALAKCALCLEEIDLAPIACVKCESGYHPECWEHSEGCARKACRASVGETVARG